MKNNSEGLKDIKRELIYANSSIIILGLLISIFPETSGDILCRAIGAILAIWGIIRIVAYFMSENTVVLSSFGLVQGVALLGFGVYFLIKPEALSSILIIIFAFILIIGSVMKFQYTFDFFRLKFSLWWIELISAILMAGLGVTALINPFTATKVLMIFIGVSLIVDGVWDLISVIYLSKVAKEVKNIMGIKTGADKSDGTDYVDATAENKTKE